MLWFKPFARSSPLIVLLPPLGLFAGDSDGAVAIEYGLIAALVVLAIIGGLEATFGATNSLWGHVGTSVVNALTTP